MSKNNLLRGSRQVTIPNQTSTTISIPIEGKSYVGKIWWIGRNAGNTKQYTEEDRVSVPDSATGSLAQQTANNGFTFTAITVTTGVAGEFQVQIETDAAFGETSYWFFQWELIEMPDIT